MCLKTAGWVANGADSDQMLIWVYTVCSGLFVQILRVNRVYRDTKQYYIYSIAECFSRTKNTPAMALPNIVLKNAKDLRWLEITIVNTYHTMGRFSRRQTDDIFLIFPRKQDLTLHANCLLQRQFAWSVKSYFLGKIRKTFQNVICWNIYPAC